MVKTIEMAKGVRVTYDVTPEEALTPKAIARIIEALLMSMRDIDQLVISVSKIELRTNVPTDVEAMVLERKCAELKAVAQEAVKDYWREEKG
jgi:hypothetical protein